MIKLFIQFGLGLLVGIYGYLFPGYINLGVFQLGMNAKKQEIQKVLFIIAFVEIPYCFFSMSSMHWIIQQSILLIIIKWLIVILLLGLGIMTFVNAKKENHTIENNMKKTASLDSKKLLFFAIFNPFQLSAWAIWGTYFIEKSWFEWTRTSIFIFSIGASIGVYFILLAYSYMGQKLIQYFSSHREKINYGMAFLLIGLGVFQFIRNII
jgi:cytochrome c biogenesis protein CcdA